MPFQVALYDPFALDHEDPTDLLPGQFCGGVILDATHVITAAHCVTFGGFQAQPPEDFAVLAGSANLETPGGEAVEDPVLAVSFDPEWNPLTASHDIGLLTLENPLWSGSAPALDGVHKIAPVPLASSEPAADAPLTVSGWGYTEALTEGQEPENIAAYPARLQVAQVPLVERSLCQSDYASRGLTIEPDLLCAGGPSGEPDACYGDSGGPLVIDGAQDPQDFQLLGTVDLGAGCGQKGAPGVYQSLVDAGNAEFVRSHPPQAPLDLTAPTLLGTAEPGQSLRCDPGAWRGEPRFSYRFFRDESTISDPDVSTALTPGYSSVATYVIGPGDVATRIFCAVFALNGGGYGGELSEDVTVSPAAGGGTSSSPSTVTGQGVAPSPVPPPLQPAPAGSHPAPPTLQVLSKRCARASCTVSVHVSEGIGATAVKTVQAKLTFRLRYDCRRRGRIRTCFRTATRTLAARAMPGDHFTILATALAPREYTLALSAVDAAGVHQTVPTKVALVVKPAPSKRGTRPLRD